MNAIQGFTGEYRFLSNFFLLPDYITEVYEDENTGIVQSIKFPTVEHAYQASKYLTVDRIRLVANSRGPGEAKRQGRLYAARSDWNRIKLDVMLYFVRKKFAMSRMKAMLLATGDSVLWEANTWGDVFWGVDEFLEGENHLGSILMQVRQEIQDQN
jgi:ribA/ribD-fused uncharacterized protein